MLDWMSCFAMFAEFDWGAWKDASLRGGLIGALVGGTVGLMMYLTKKKKQEPKK